MRLGILGMLVGAGVVVCSISDATAGQTPSGATRHRAAEALRLALVEADSPQAALGARREQLLAAARIATEILGPSTLAGARLGLAVERANPLGDAEAIDLLRRELAEIAGDLDFRPREEASQPAGFPEPTVVGEIEVKRYPAYRKAQAETSPNLAFWTLFTHIKQNGIAMTAPVEMEYDRGAAGSQEESMAFLYGDPALGKPGKRGWVDVVDVPAMTVVSIGVRGERNAESIGAAEKQLSTWLAAHSADWVMDGSLRVMAHNSPFVPRDENYFEVQLPVRPAK